jgi:hypothetical protein
VKLPFHAFALFGLVFYATCAPGNATSVDPGCSVRMNSGEHVHISLPYAVPAEINYPQELTYISLVSNVVSC